MIRFSGLSVFLSFLIVTALDCKLSVITSDSVHKNTLLVRLVSQGSPALKLLLLNLLSSDFSQFGKEFMRIWLSLRGINFTMET